MKKLMLTAAAVAMAGAASAITQVYDVRINLKTTACRKTTIAANQNPFRAAAGEIWYRAQASRTIQGLIWACECDYLVDMGNAVAANINWNVLGAIATSWVDNTANFYYNDPVGGDWGCRYVKAVANNQYNPAAGVAAEGFVFWDAQTRVPFGYNVATRAALIDTRAATAPLYAANNMQTWRPRPEASMPIFTWGFLQRFGARAEKVEGMWTLRDILNGRYQLVGAGFGTNRAFGQIGAVVDGATAANEANPIREGVTTFDATNARAVYNAIDTDADGNFDQARWNLEECGDAIIAQMSGNVAGFLDPAGNDCVFCAGGICNAYPFCRCYVSTYNNGRTAAYGTWTLRYNAGLSNQLLATDSIRNIYNFSTETARIVEWLEANAL